MQKVIAGNCSIFCGNLLAICDTVAYMQMRFLRMKLSQTFRRCLGRMEYACKLPWLRDT